MHASTSITTLPPVKGALSPTSTASTNGTTSVPPPSRLERGESEPCILGGKLPALSPNGRKTSIDHGRRLHTEISSSRLFIHRSSAKIFGVSLDFMINVWNDGISELLGIPSDDAIGKSIYEIFSPVADVENSDNIKALFTLLHESLQGTLSMNKTLYLTATDGTEKFLLVNSIPLYKDDAEIEVNGVMCVSWNISSLSQREVEEVVANEELCRKEVHSIQNEMKHLSAALAAAEKRFKDTLDMKRNFVRGVSHEIRTPLNVVFAGLQLIETHMAEQVSPEVLSLIREIKQSSQDGVDILDDLLAYEKMDGKLLVLEKEPISANALLKDCVAPFLMQARLADVKIELFESGYINEGSEYSRDYIINVDHFKVRQVLRNLISNAVKFTPARGTVRCVVSWKPTCEEKALVNDKGFVRIDVIDNGVGLAKESQDRLFKEIVQFNAAANQGGGGSGLGLWLSKSLVSLNGGTIGVTSIGLGHGSTFFVEFPLMDSMLDMQHKKHSSDLGSRPNSNLELAMLEVVKFSKLLVVDDSTLSRKMVARLLRANFKDVVEANDGMDALNQYSLAVAAGDPFEVVLMDNQMPNMNGLEAAAELRKLGFTGALIGLSGYGEREQIDDFMKAGADYVMVKPLSHTKLLKVVRNILQSSATKRSSLESKKGSGAEELFAADKPKEEQQEHV